jgi:hypothetical protein
MKRVMIKNTKGMSTVVSTVIMIALVIAAVAVVWGFVYPMIEENLESSGDCQDIVGKIELNNGYTCYDSMGEKLYFMIEQKDVETANKLIVKISAGLSPFSVEIPGDDNVTMCSEEPVDAELPGKNRGKTYYVGVSSEVDSIGIIPEVGGKQCTQVDSISDVRNCDTMLKFDDLKEACGTYE